MTRLEATLLVSAILHGGAFLIFFAAALYSFRQGNAFRKAKAEIDKLYAEGKEHISKLAHEGNKELLKWVMRNANRDNAS